MAGLILRRLGRALLTLLIAVSLVFILIRLSGDPAAALAPPDAPQEVIDQLRERMGLDRPLIVQYVNYLAGLAQGNFGYSIHTGQPVQQIFLARLPATLALGGMALVISVVGGIALGTIAALNRNSALDRMVMAFSVFAFAMPNFFFGILVILGGALLFGSFYGSTGATSIGLAMILAPAATLGLASMGTFARFTRSSLLEVLNRPYMTAIAGRGVPGWRRLLLHAFPNAAIPIVTLLGLSIGGLVAGAVVTEQVFSWPGVGSLLVRSVQTRDIAVIQFIVLAVAATMTLTNLAVDVLYRVLDPRIRTSGHG